MLFVAYGACFGVELTMDGVAHLYFEWTRLPRRDFVKFREIRIRVDHLAIGVKYRHVYFV